MDKKAIIQRIYNLTPMQEGILFHNILDKYSSAYFEQMTFSFTGKLDIGLLEKSFNLLIARHEVLRTNFVHEKVKKPQQVVLKDRELKIHFEDISDIDDHGKSQYVLEFQKKDRERGFDLLRDLLTRVSVIKLDKDSYRLIWSHHHIIMDGWCLGVIIKELLQIYICLNDHKSIDLGPIYPYIDYIKWLERQDKNEALNYWVEYLKGYEQQAVLPKDKNISSGDGYKKEEECFTIDENLTACLEGIANEAAVTINSVLQTVWGILLQRYNNTNDVVFGSVVSGRPPEIAGIENMVGLFINTVPVRVKLADGQPFTELVKNVHDECIASRGYEYFSLAEIQSSTELKQNLIDNIMVFENYPVQKEIVESSDRLAMDFTIDSMEIYEQVNYDFGIIIVPGRELQIRFNYNAYVYTKDFIKNLEGHLKEIIRAVSSNPSVQVSEISILTEKEKRIIINDFNHKYTEILKDKTIYELFEEQVRRTPNATAICYSVDLSDVCKGLLGETDLSDLYGKLENCCFTRNNFTYVFDASVTRESTLFKYNEKKEMRLLQTSGGECFVVNNNTLAFLDCLSGQYNLKAVFEALADTEVKIPVWSVNPAEKPGQLSINKKEYILDNDFGGLVQLIQTLYVNKLINLTGYDTQELQEATGIKDQFQKALELIQIGEECEPITSDQNNMDRLEGSGPVLLLGDTPGVPTSGLLYLASYLRRHGIEAYCQMNDLCTNYDSLKENIERLLNKIKPEVVGVSMKWFPHMARALEICKIVKEHSKAIKIVVGGNTASFYPEEIITYEYVDYILTGDGELPLLKICQGADSIPNCLYKKDGDLVRSSEAYVQNKDNSSDVFFSHLEDVIVSSDMHKVIPYIFICTGKGCSANCFYCAGCRDVQKNSFNRIGPYMRRPEDVRKDIAEAVKFTSTLMFDFDLPNYDSLDYYRKIWDGIDLTNHFCTFFFWKVPSKEFIALVTKTFKHVRLNIDLCSLSERHRMKLASMKVVKPQPTDYELISALDECEKYSNIEVVINQIAGLPYFGQEDIEASEKLTLRLVNSYENLGGIDWGRLHAQPGAPIVNNCEQFGMYTNAKTFEDFLYYSELNMKEQYYPDLAFTNYPLIYFEDDSMNSKITKHYSKINRILIQNSEKKIKNKKINASMTYMQLNEKANQLSKVLRERGVKQDSIVGVMADGYPEIVIGIMAVLKSGGAYLPIDPMYPEERVRFMLEDSEARILLTQKKYISGFRGNVQQIIDLEDRDLYSGDGSNPLKINNTKDLAYVIYTSGTTGKPKGVMIEHGSICNAIEWRKNEYRLGSDDAVLQLFSFAFDGFVTSFFTPIVSGAKVILPNYGERRDVEALKKYIVSQNITHFICVPSLYSAILDSIDRKEAQSIRIVTLAGERTTNNLVEKSIRVNPKIELVNEYGPTENSVVATVLRNMQQCKDITIGKPITNVRAYIVDRNNNLQPVGIPGELCLSGGGLARGYLNRPELTDEKFASCWFDDFNDKNSSNEMGHMKIYKTGDLARWLPDGSIDFIGRIDHQVKIRGYRIELGEIESEILALDTVKEVAILDRESAGKGKYLCAYFVAHKKIGSAELKEHLAKRLPDYMIPSSFVQMDKLPLTPNGKIDRNAMPEPDSIASIETGFVAPRNRTEEKLAGLWKEILDVERVGINDSFFDLGGHSLKATMLVSKIYNTFTVEVPLKEVFDRQTVRELAKYIDGSDESMYSSIQKVEKSEYYPASSAQKRIFVVEQMGNTGSSYNMPVVTILEGALDVDKLEGIFELLIKRHEILRTSFCIIKGELVQRIHEHIEFKMNYIEADENELEDLIEEFIQPFDLTRAPLFRVKLIRISEDKHVLMYDMHHIISDGISQLIFMKEILNLYEGENLPDLSIQYKDFAVWQKNLFKSEAFRKQEAYWLNKFKDEIPLLDIPLDYQRPAVQSFEGDDFEFEAERELTLKLKNLAAETGTTLYMILLAAFYVLLNKYTRQEDIVIGTAVAGRPHPDIWRVMGMFVNTLPIRNYPREDREFREFLNEVKANLLEDFEHPDYPLEELINKLNIKRDSARNPMIDTVFIMQNIQTEELGESSLRFVPYEYKNKTAKFDLSLSAIERGEEIQFTFEYCTSLFKKETIEMLADHYMKIIKSIVENPEITIRNIELLDQSRIEEANSKVLRAKNELKNKISLSFDL